MWNKKLKRIPAAVLAGILLLLSFSCAWAEDTGRQTIKVAFPTQEGMSFFGHSGKVTGYNYDYLEKISEYTGWVMDYVPYGSDDGNEAVGSALQDLQSGKVDLMGPLLKNAATEKLFEFPENSYGTVYTTLNALSTGSLRESGLHSVEKLRVGLWETAATRNSEVMTFLESENISYEIVTYATAAAQQQALIDGNVDVIPSVSLSPVNNARIVARFAPRPYYFAATKGNTDLGSSSSSVERLQFVVSDNGYGITDEFKKVIFDPFTRSEDSTTNKETGTGLGLAITKNIIDLMGGTIELESELGKGSTFTVELPLRLPHEEADEHFWEHHNMSRILLVDDDRSVCDGVKENMADSGVDFDTAYSGEEAVALV